MLLLKLVIGAKKSSLSSSKHIAAILFMVANAFFISLLYIIVKILTRDFSFSSNQVSLLYKITILVITLLSCINLGIKHHLKTNKLIFHALRGFFSIAGSLSMFYAVSIMKVINAAAISELVPVFMVLAGIIVFNEKFTFPKVVLLLGSITGVLFIKDFHNFGRNIEPGYFYAFLALIFWSINNVIIKKLTKTEHSRAQLFYSSFFASLFALPLAFLNFSCDFSSISFNISIAEWPEFSYKGTLLMLSAGVSSLLHKLSFFRAYKLSDMSMVGPFDYLRLPLSGIFAYIILGESVTSIYSLIGYAIIIVSSIYFVLQKEQKKN